jgi:hypothetical protein
MNCFPLGNENFDCCARLIAGDKCDYSEQCRGASVCTSGTCTGESLCDSVCEQEINGDTVDCCVSEQRPTASCKCDKDCNGVRTCDMRTLTCVGESGCVFNMPHKKRVLYDKECLCLGAGQLCSIHNGVPCLSNCRFSTDAEVIKCVLP